MKCVEFSDDDMEDGENFFGWVVVDWGGEEFFFVLFFGFLLGLRWICYLLFVVGVVYEVVVYVNIGMWGCRMGSGI